MVGLYLRTAQHYRSSQIAARLRLGVDAVLLRKSSWLRRRRYDVPALLIRNEQAKFFGAESPQRGIVAAQWTATAKLCEQGRFTLLNRTINLGSPIDWRALGMTRLWRYNLHYFDYVLDLALLAKHHHDEPAATLAHLCVEWINANPLGEGIGWHSYPVARRLVNWIQSISLASLDVVFPDAHARVHWIKSLYQQAMYLEDRLELDCLGNHLVADAKALVFAGIFFADKAAARWLDKGQRMLWNGLREQILEDGGHYERSPMYHAIVLQDYLETVLAFQLNRREVPSWVRERLLAMGDFLSGILHPDGEIPLFGDSAFGIARSSNDILAAAEVLLDAYGRWPESKPGAYCALIAPQAFQRAETATVSPRKCNAWPQTGYIVLRGTEPGDQMIIDAKPMGPEHVPAHGHCSLFSYELSIAGQRLIVDSGVDEYQPGPWRNFWRSTRAHNTVLVDGQEQSEIWAAFRVGRRCRVLDAEYMHRDSSALFVATHDGFAHKDSRINHRRFIATLPHGVWLVLEEITGTGRHMIESLVHFHPQAACEVHNDHAEIGLQSLRVNIHPYAANPGTTTRMTCLRGQEHPMQGWYAAEFGKRQANSVLSVSSDTELPARLGYVIAPSHRKITSWDLQYNELGGAFQCDVCLRSSQGDILQHFDGSEARSILSNH